MITFLSLSLFSSVLTWRCTDEMFFFWFCRSHASSAHDAAFTSSSFFEAEFEAAASFCGLSNDICCNTPALLHFLCFATNWHVTIFFYYRFLCFLIRQQDGDSLGIRDILGARDERKRLHFAFLRVEEET